MAADPERRRRRTTYGVTAFLVLAVAGASVVTQVVKRSQEEPTRPVSSYGVAAADAGCQPARTEPATGVGVHVGPGTDAPDALPVDYESVPPTSGPHWPVPAYPNLAFYSVRDVPRVEQLVHNLEHGYTVLWYDPALPEESVEQVRVLAARVRLDEPKFIAAPWDTTRGPLPGGATVALSHWGAREGYRQLCARLSGEVVAAFLGAYPASDSPWPDAA